MKQIFKTLSISILTVLSISLNLYAVNSGDWTSFETIVADTASTDNIVLTGDIVFEMNSLSLGHNLEIDGGNFYLSG
ncbi:MAG: hypothetical protein LBH29_02710, partial [Elusimicrobiota bacterium]|nr:hypothetical protein [Elusimicrobiota bacterium]